MMSWPVHVLPAFDLVHEVPGQPVLVPDVPVDLLQRGIAGEVGSAMQGDVERPPSSSCSSSPC